MCVSLQPAGATWNPRYNVDGFCRLLRDILPVTDAPTRRTIHAKLFELLGEPRPRRMSDLSQEQCAIVWRFLVASDLIPADVLPHVQPDRKRRPVNIPASFTVTPISLERLLQGKALVALLRWNLR